MILADFFEEEERLERLLGAALQAEPPDESEIAALQDKLNETRDDIQRAMASLDREWRAAGE